MMRVDKTMCIQVIMGLAMVAGMVWAGFFIRDRLTRSRVEEMLAGLDADSGAIDPAVAKELHGLGDRAMDVLAERLKEGRFGEGKLRMALLAVGAPAVGALAEALDDEKPEVRLFAAETLGKIEGKRKDIVRALVGALGDKSPGVRAAAAAALGNRRIDAQDATTALLECLDDNEAPVRRAAILAIGNVATGQSDVVEDLGAALADTDGPVRQAAVDTLVGFGTPDEAIGALAGLLSDPREPAEIRLACVGALRDIAPRGEAAIGALRKLLDGPDRRLALEAIGVLGRHEADRTETTTALVRALGHADDEIRVAAAESLGNYGEEARGATAGLLTCLQDKAWPVRKAAATAVGKVAAPTSQAPAALVRALGDTDYHVREAAVLALMDLDMPDATLGAVIKTLDNDAEGLTVRWACAHALGQAGKRGRPAIAALKKAAKHANPRLRKQAAEALASIREDTQ